MKSKVKKLMLKGRLFKIKESDMSPLIITLEILTIRGAVINNGRNVIYIPIYIKTSLEEMCIAAEGIENGYYNHPDIDIQYISKFKKTRKDKKVRDLFCTLNHHPILIPENLVVPYKETYFYQYD